MSARRSSETESSQFQRFGLREAYGVADALRLLTLEDDPDGLILEFEEGLSTAPQLEAKALVPDRETLLHLLIAHYLDASSDYLRRKGDPSDLLRDYVASFDAHGIETPTAVRKEFDRYWSDRSEQDIDDGDSTGDEVAAEDDEPDEELKADALAAAYELYVDACIPKIRTEVFTLLFGDRPFLLGFNERVAKLVTPLLVVDHPDLLERDGVVNRCLYWPEWLRRALMFRDKGHCAICLKDISNLVFVSDKGYHVDHIVPLDLGGTNDPTNLQLLCETCNLTKGAAKAKTSSICMVYW